MRLPRSGWSNRHISLFHAHAAEIQWADGSAFTKYSSSRHILAPEVGLRLRGIYFPMMVLSLAWEALWGHRSRGGNPDSPHPVRAMLSSVPAEAATSEEG
jgi:hypothetical protein